MSIRRIGGFNPSIQTANLVNAQRRIEAVEKSIGTDDDLLDPEESLRLKQQAELEQLEAERAAQAREADELRAQLTLVDGYEQAPRELVDLKGGVDKARPQAPGAEGGQDRPGVSLASLARESVYAAAQAQQRAEEAARASALEDGFGDVAEARPDDNWMAAELEALQSQLESELGDVDGVDDEEASYSDPGADSFLASTDDVANLELDGSEYEDPGADAFLASMDDIANLVPESEPEAPAAVEAQVAEAAPAVSIEADAAAPAAGEPAVALPFDEEAAPAPVPAAEQPPEAVASPSVALPFETE